MLSLAERRINPSVVNDQRGRLTFTPELARAIRHLIDTYAPYGTYNVTGSGTVTSWADVARRTFALAGHGPNRVNGVSTQGYFSKAAGPVAPRSLNSVLDLAKIQSSGHSPVDADQTLEEYVAWKPSR
jgi:dTDP-4-dehydrorhamnose reductase